MLQCASSLYRGRWGEGIEGSRGRGVAPAVLRPQGREGASRPYPLRVEGGGAGEGVDDSEVQGKSNVRRVVTRNFCLLDLNSARWRGEDFFYVIS